MLAHILTVLCMAILFLPAPILYKRLDFANVLDRIGLSIIITISGWCVLALVFGITVGAYSVIHDIITNQ